MNPILVAGLGQDIKEKVTIPYESLLPTDPTLLKAPTQSMPSKTHISTLSIGLSAPDMLSSLTIERQSIKDWKQGIILYFSWTAILI
jgi:hypothetical protein